MTEKLAGMSPLEQAAKKTITPAEAERAAVRQLVKSARERGEDLTSPDGLLKVITKTVLTDTADVVEVQVPRDRDGTFPSVIVAKRARRLSAVDAVVLSLYAKG